MIEEVEIYTQVSKETRAIGGTITNIVDINSLAFDANYEFGSLSRSSLLATVNAIADRLVLNRI